MTAVADTSFLYALFSATDTHHASARQQLGRADRVLVPPEILAETLALVHRRLSFDLAVAAKKWLDAQPTFKPVFGGEDDAQRSWDVYQHHRGRLTYADSVVVAWARRERCGVLAYDRSLAGAARTG